MGIESHQKVQTVSRLNFYINYLDQINQYINKLTVNINNQLNLLNLNQLNLDDPLKNEDYILSSVSSTVKSMTKIIMDSVPWRKLEDELYQLKMLLHINSKDDLNNLESFLTSFTSIVQKI